MGAEPSTLALAGTGFVVGWNIAWVPGPINAEILRRGARGGFGAGFVVGAGASTSDFCWATALALGGGALAESPRVKWGLALASTLLLAGLAAVFLRGAWRSLRAARRGEALPAGSPRFESRRGGWLLGFLTAFTSPYNLAFWIAMVGQQVVRGGGTGTALLFGASVVCGALSWCVVLSAASRLGAGLPAPAWDAALRAVAAGFLLWFGARSAALLAG
jgi:threonine/homoserine/homoserine lactone efflux protein